MEQSSVARQWDMFIHGIDARRERIVKNASPFSPDLRGEVDLRGIYPRIISRRSPAGERVTPPSISSRGRVRPRAGLIERVFCRSIGRQRRIGSRKRERRERDGENRWGRRERKREENNHRCKSRHANSCRPRRGKVSLARLDLTDRNLVSDIINIGLVELSRPRISVANESARRPKANRCGFSYRTITQQPPLY